MIQAGSLVLQINSDLKNAYKLIAKLKTSLT